MLSKNDKDSIAAGAKSLQAGLGGFVAKRYDRQVAKIIATKGQWARKMLARVVMLHRTDTDPKRPEQSRTFLTLLVLEGGAVTECRRAWLEKQGAKAAAWGPLVWKEKCTHDAATGALLCAVTVYADATRAVTLLSATAAADDIYTGRAVVDRITLNVATADVVRAEKEMLDPLSFSSFLELIEEQQSLPACVYQIAAVQGPAVLFDAKEHLRITPGARDGAEMTSFSYFRMLARVGKEGALPGAFSQGNFALPLACDPISSRVLASLMPGLLSEPITGSSLAPLTESGLFYLAFVYHHLRVAKLSALDLRRIAQWLGERRAPFRFALLIFLSRSIA